MKVPSKKWVPEQLDITRAKIAKVVDPALLPSDMMKALGCGRYGCVYTTSAPGIVFKLTSDESEARFAQFAIDLARHEGGIPSGITHYFLVAETKLMRDRVFGVWRERVSYTSDAAFEAAESVYGQDDVSAGDKHFLLYDEFAGFFHEHFWNVDKRAIRSRLKKHGLPEYEAAVTVAHGRKYKQRALQQLKYEYRTDPGFAMAHAISLCMIETYFMQQYDSTRYVGIALGHYIKKGVLLADVHIGNIGFEARADVPHGAFVIFDVGQALFFGFNRQSVPLMRISQVDQRDWFSR